jgi:hypothetical protein
MVAALGIAASVVGWLAVFGWALSGPRLGRAGKPGRARVSAVRVPEAVVALMAGLSARDQFKVALLDLSARGWFRLTGSGVRAVCVIPVEAPVEELSAYEHTAVRHLAKRAGTHEQLPADALADGFDGGEDKFLASFRKEVVQQARGLGLTRPTLSVRRKVLLCLLGLVPALAPLLATRIDSHQAGEVLGICVVCYLLLCMVVVCVSSERLTAYGHDALATWRATPDPSGQVSAAALGRDVAVLVPFAAPGKNRVWSGYGEDWRLLRVGNPAERVWPGISHAAFRVLVAVTLPGIPLLMVLIALAGYDFRLGVLAGLAIDLAVFVKASTPWLRLPRRAEFDGQVVRQWDVITGDDEHPSRCCVAIDDGTRQQAWALTVIGHASTWLAPGTVVHVRMNPRLNKVISIEPIRFPAGAPQLLNPTPDPRAGS